MKRALLLVAIGCGVRAPAPLDVGALVATRGPAIARLELEARVLASPRDMQARLALAALDERLARPSAAIDQLEAVERLGGPLGVRWHDDDRARLARLVKARGEARLARGSAGALGELLRAAKLGATIPADELDRARRAKAIVELRHVDAEVRARGRAALQGAQDAGAFGAFAWSVGARREAYDQLARWRATAPTPRDPALDAAYLRALAWWSPPEAAVPDDAGELRCWFVAAGCPPPPREPAAVALVEPADRDPHAWAAVRYAVARAGGGERAGELYAIARAFGREPAVAERLGRDFVATSVDDAWGDAALGALFDALGDPARSRAAWQSAVDRDGSAAYYRGLAEAAARGGDAPAALVFATTAAAASGDPAEVWLAIARALDAEGLHVDALVAAHSAIELGDVDVLPAALDVAIAASRALGRDEQVAALSRQRARLWSAAELEETVRAVRALPAGTMIDRAWEVSRRYPREVELRVLMVRAMAAEDARREVLVDELVELAGDASDLDGAREAAAALR